MAETIKYKIQSGADKIRRRKKEEEEWASKCGPVIVTKSNSKLNKNE